MTIQRPSFLTQRTTSCWSGFRERRWIRGEFQGPTRGFRVLAGGAGARSNRWISAPSTRTTSRRIQVVRKFTGYVLRRHQTSTPNAAGNAGSPATTIQNSARSWN